MNKKYKKILNKKCIFCNTTDLEVLDVHRIEYGSRGGKYTDFNTCICCSNCHRKIHNDKIKIISKNYSTKGKFVIIYIDEDGIEKIAEE